ncbi:hypothetical protein EDD18DRAFT_1098889 [Armillaria luteobubalina]|uniref:Uncharacterized protein n=1 Tax=Armillaria luteobubalina TaxID=153913 RepID=A0AA39V4Q8_9AGAR|nr:hypothetical protein EDD18DRAFT_1098889 [Armillaria luteobubalina]
MSPSITDELPLITPRMCFRPILSDQILPTITTRVCFSRVMSTYEPVRDIVMADGSAPAPMLESSAEHPVPPFRESVYPRPSPAPNAPAAAPERPAPVALPALGPSSDLAAEPPRQPSPTPVSGQTQEPAPAQTNDQPAPDPRYDKPTGEPGQPSNGGFSLEKKLLEQCGWSKEQYKRVRGDVRTWASAKLNFSLCYKSQKTDNVDKVIQKATKKYPWLESYDDCWPVVAILKGILKNESYNHRQIKKAKAKHRRQSRRVSASDSSSSSDSHSD